MSDDEWVNLYSEFKLVRDIHLYNLEIVFKNALSEVLSKMFSKNE